MKKFLVLAVATLLPVGVTDGAFAGDVEATPSHDISEFGKFVRQIADPLNKIQFIKISSTDAKAVIRAVDDKMQVIKPGDTLVENVIVKEIIPGRLILEEKTAQGFLETVTVRMDGAKTRIER